MTDWRSVPVPKKMRALARDRRGYPVPFIILRDTDGRPHYTINDSVRHRKCLTEMRCPICGTRLDKPFWLVGGPLSVFHEHGAFLDTGLHYECMRYALQVCPYLAAPVYSGRIDTVTIKPEKTPPGCQVLLDPTMIPERPALFVAVAANAQKVNYGGIMATIQPERPYKAIEYWQRGQQITEADAMPLVESALKAFTTKDTRDLGALCRR